MLSNGKQELVNFLFSMVFVVILLVIIFLGVEENGEFKYAFVGKTISWLLSTLTLEIVMIYVLPMFLYLLIKAALFKVPLYSWFNVVAQTITGVFYSLGMSISSFTLVVVAYGVPFNRDIFIFGLVITFAGYALYHMLQACIQRTSNPLT
ncbi:hypothetical protein AB9M41_004931 [Vibrio alginolyticus]